MKQVRQFEAGVSDRALMCGQSTTFALVVSSLFAPMFLPLFIALVGVVLLHSLPVLGAKQVISEKQIDELRQNTFISTLTNGMSVVQRKTPYDVAAVEFVIDWDRSDQMFAHNWDLHRQFIAALMVKQTQRWNKEQLQDFKMENVGSFSCAPTPGCYNSGRLSCSMVVPQENFTQGMDLLASVVLEPKFADEDLEVAQKRALVQIKQCSLDKAKRIGRKLDSIISAPASYFHTYYDLRPYVEKLTAQDLERTYRLFLNGRRMHISVVGSQDHDALLKEVRSRFGKVPSWHFIKPVLDYRGTISFPIYHSERIVKIEEESYPNVKVRIEATADRPGIYSSYYRPMSLLANIMHEQFFKAMRIHQGLSYAPWVSRASINFSTSQLPQAMKVTQKFVEDMRRDPLMGDSIEEYKNQFYYYHYNRYKSSMNIAENLAFYYLSFNRAEEEFTFPLEIIKADAETIRFLASEVLRDFKMSFMGPKKLLGDLSVYENYFDPPIIEVYP